MKGFFKKHPELLVLLIVVIIIDAIIVYMWMGDNTATAEAEDEHKKLDQAAEAIIKSKFKVSAQNAKLAEDETAKWEKTFDELIAARQEKYVVTGESFEQSATAKRVLKERVDHLSQKLLKEKDKTADKLSFFTYAYENTLLSMKSDDIQNIFVILKGVEHLVGIAVKSDIISLDLIQRPNDLAYVEDKALKTKRYTYNLKFAATADGMKKFINQIVNDDVYFWEINSIKINAIEQVSASTSDLVPKILRQGNSQANTPKKDGIRGLEEGFDNLVNPKKDEADPEEAFIYKDSISPFSQAVNNIEISIDWVQFTKE